MKIKALRSFCGKVTMRGREIRDVEDGIAQDLIRAGHAVALETEKAAALSKKAKAVEKPVEKTEETPVEPVEEPETDKTKK